MFSNQKGSAVRNWDKSVRVSTHRPVVEFVLSNMNDNLSVVEHGMGIASTSLFHEEKKIRRILSFEDDEKWSKCNHCKSHLDDTEHSITSFNSIEKCKEVINYFVKDVKSTLALVDGPQLQRIELLRIVQEMKIPYIVEHDAEALDDKSLELRMKSSVNNAYNVYQYVGRNPETMIYTFLDIKDSNYIKL